MERVTRAMLEARLRVLAGTLGTVVLDFSKYETEPASAIHLDSYAPAGTRLYVVMTKDGARVCGSERGTAQEIMARMEAAIAAVGWYKLAARDRAAREVRVVEEYSIVEGK